MYLDVTPVAGKGQTMPFFRTPAPSIGRNGTTCFFFATQRLRLDVKAQHAFL
jgi:hypothetical protein